MPKKQAIFIELLGRVTELTELLESAIIELRQAVEDAGDGWVEQMSGETEE